MLPSFWFCLNPQRPDTQQLQTNKTKHQTTVWNQTFIYQHALSVQSNQHIPKTPLKDHYYTAEHCKGLQSTEHIFPRLLRDLVLGRNTAQALLKFLFFNKFIQ